MVSLVHGFPEVLLLGAFPPEEVWKYFLIDFWKNLRSVTIKTSGSLTKWSQSVLGFSVGRFLFVFYPNLIILLGLFKCCIFFIILSQQIIDFDSLPGTWLLRYSVTTFSVASVLVSHFPYLIFFFSWFLFFSFWFDIAAELSGETLDLSPGVFTLLFPKKSMLLALIISFLFRFICLCSSLPCFLISFNSGGF